MTTNTNILQKFTNHYQKTITYANSLILASPNKKIEPSHILTSLIKQKGSLAYEILNKVNPQRYILANNGSKLNFENIIQKQLSPESKKIIISSTKIASDYGHKYIGTEHLLYALATAKNKTIEELLKKQSLNPKHLTDHLEIILNSTSHFPPSPQSTQTEPAKTKIKKRSSKKPEMILDYFATCLTDHKVQLDINPVIGRGQEIDQIIQIIARKNKNNPILLGEPGVGKTAIIEGLAKKIIEAEVPDFLLDKKIYSLDMPALIAGTSYRGDFEARIKYIVEELKSNPDIILFIDEIHNIIGAGSASGTMDAANIIKPALARGQIRCIGATTFDDYKKFIEPDSALTRRFQPVQIQEPTPSETVKIIQGIKKYFENHHHVAITDEAIETASYLSHRYLTNTFLPDKAIDLIDQAAAAKKISLPQNENYKNLLFLKKKLELLSEQKTKFIAEDNLEQALKIKLGELKLFQEIHDLEKKQITDDLRQSSQTNIKIISKDIIELVKTTSGIEIPDTASPQKNLKRLKTNLSRHIIGQDQAITELSHALIRSAAGLSGAKRPLGSFVFMGPSGVGKTHTAQILAKNLFGQKENLIRLDMSEFSESYNTSKIIGAPAGYIGHDQGGVLTEAVKRNPYSVVLLDEIEKAHPDIFNILLQILEDGQLRDSKGKAVNFRNTIIIMTTNIGLKKSGEKQSVGFENDDSKNILNHNFKDSLSEFLRPELINRIDQILVFNSLTKTDIKKIINLELNYLNQTISHQNLNLKWDKNIINYLADLYNNFDQGARAIRPLLRHHIENPLSEKIINREIKHHTITLSLRQNQLTLI